MHIVKKLQKSKYIVAAGLAAFTIAIGLVAVAPATSASAAKSCHVFWATTDFYEAGKVTTNKYTVPYWSECEDINVRNITARDESGKLIPGDHCATFTVQFFPSGGREPYFGAPKYVCSQGANGPVVPIATDVYNGTKYRILHNVEELGRTHAYQIVD